MTGANTTPLRFPLISLIQRRTNCFFSSALTDEIKVEDKGEVAEEVFSIPPISLGRNL